MSNYTAQKQELLKWTKQCFAEALFAGTSGNLSTYDAANGIMYITPSSVAYETMTADDIMAIKLDGTILEGPHKPSSEWRMHAEVYKAKPEVGALVHTHSPYATSFAVSDMVIPVILIEMVPFLGGDVPVARFAVPGTPEVGFTALDALQGRNACMLQNHGVLAVGKDLAQAHIRAVYVEDAAKIYSLAIGNGRVGVVPEAAIQQMLGK